MAYRFRRRASMAHEVRRVVRERLDKAAQQLDSEPAAREEGIHEARKRFKEIRAVLRLARAGLGDRYTVENRWYRDAGRALAEARDAQAAIETWHKLEQRFPELAQCPESEVLRGRLKRRLRRLARGDGTGERARVEILRSLPAARERLERWPLEGSGFVLIGDGLERSYRQGRRAMHRACGEAADELTFHEWRKRVKDLWYHTRLLAPLWHEIMHVRETALKTLSDQLGDDHDLAMLAQLRRDRPRLFGPKAFADLASAKMALRQRELRRDACALGGLLYAEGARAYAKRMAVYWELWRA